MRELRLFLSYLLGCGVVATLSIAGAVYAALQGVHYIPEASLIVSATKKEEPELHAELIRAPDAPPVWIAPTPKYNYDSQLMIVKPREERLKEAELRASKEWAKYQAERKAKQKVAQQQLRLPQQRNAYAYQPEQRVGFGLFPFFR